MSEKLYIPGLLMVVAVVIMVACDSRPRPTPRPSPESAQGTSTVPTEAPSTSATLTLPSSPLPGQTTTPPPGTTDTPTNLPTPASGSTPSTDNPATPPIPRSIPTQLIDGEFPDAPDRDLFELARSLSRVAGPIPRIVNPTPVSYTEGRRDTFRLTDIRDVRTYTAQATLRLVSPRAYWYIEDGLEVSQRDLEKASRVFENEIYPRVTAAFGTEWTPGVDNDPHITILNARLRGPVAGYFSSVDEYPSMVRQHSNQREMIYLDAGSLIVGSPIYLSVIAHELQHAIHWHGDPTEETWVNEGLSEMAASVAGYRPSSQGAFLGSPTTSLVNWPIDSNASPHYGAAFLFFDYLAAHYGSPGDLVLLVGEQADGIRGIDSYLARQGYDMDFRNIFKDWVVANYLDEPGDGVYSYPDSYVQTVITSRMSKPGERDYSIPQYSAEYIAIDITKGDIKLRFQGQEENFLLHPSLDSGSCWWSNRGDSISSSLSRTLDLSDTDKATLKFRVWFDVEEDWDYGYVEISSDKGVTWDIVEAPGTSLRNPVGNSFGPGYTGISNGWTDVEVSLTPYAGREVLLRFHYVTDDALNGMGLCFDDISVPEIGLFDIGLGDDGWNAEGFLRINNRVPQDYIVQVIEVGDETRVREMALDENNRGEMVISGSEDLDDVVVVVAALAPKTIHEAGYTLVLEPAAP